MKCRIRNRAASWSSILLLSFAAPLFAQVSPPMDPVQAIDAALRAIQTGDLKTADRLIREVSETHPKISRLNLASGLLMLEVSRYAEAIEALGLYNDTPEGKRDYRGWAAIGTVYLRSYWYSSATGPLEKALDLVPVGEKQGAVRAKIAMDLARTHLGLKNKKDAMEAIRTAHSSAERNGEIQTEVCELAIAANDIQTARAASGMAINVFNSELSVNPLSLSAHSGLGRCYQVLFTLQQAELSKKPNDGGAFIEAARLLRSIAEIERRIRLLDAHGLVLQSLESTEVPAEWNLLAAELEIDLGANAEANTRIESVLATDANNTAALALKKRLSPAGG